MPMRTRSTTKKLKELRNGFHAFKSISNNGKGIHTRFEYSYKPTSSKGGSLTSSFSSESSSPTNSMFDGSLSSSNSSMATSPSMWDSCHIASNPPRPLQRTSLQRWVKDPETGQLHILPEGKSWSPPVQAASSGRSEEANEDEIFEREYQAAMENRNYMADWTKKLIALDELNEGMAHDTLQMFTPANSPSVEEEMVWEPKAKPLGPEATEFIDETFRALPGELGVYPERWVTHQSTILRSQPTEHNILQ